MCGGEERTTAGDEGGTLDIPSVLRLLLHLSLSNTEQSSSSQPFNHLHPRATMILGYWPMDVHVA